MRARCATAYIQASGAKDFQETYLLVEAKQDRRLANLGKKRKGT